MTWAGETGQSSKSIVGGVAVRAVNSEVSLEKIDSSSVFMLAPAGYQDSTGGAVTVALASCTVGRWREAERGPGRLEREKAMAKMSSSLTVLVLLNFLGRRFSPVTLKDYPRDLISVNLRHDGDIWRIP